jgi:hypothetical protein
MQALKLLEQASARPGKVLEIRPLLFACLPLSFSLGFFLVIEGERVFYVFAFFPFQQALSIMFSFSAFA